jgi:hypothetical protein
MLVSSLSAMAKNMISTSILTLIRRPLFLGIRKSEIPSS